MIHSHYFDMTIRELSQQLALLEKAGQAAGQLYQSLILLIADRRYEEMTLQYSRRL
jgi:hypothetical protein